MGAAAIAIESHAGAALEVRRTPQIAQGQRPHAVGTQKSVVSPARFAAWSWVGFQRKNQGSWVRFAFTMTGFKRAAFHMNLMACKRAVHGHFPKQINDL